MPDWSNSALLDRLLPSFAASFCTMQEAQGRCPRKIEQYQIWHALPGDILLRVARPLGLREKAVIERVCKEWHRVLQQAQVGSIHCSSV